MDETPLAREVECPDCKTGTIPRGWRCSNCGLDWSDLVAAADFYDRLFEGGST